MLTKSNYIDMGKSCLLSILGLMTFNYINSIAGAIIMCIGIAHFITTTGNDYFEEWNMEKLEERIKNK